MCENFTQNVIIKKFNDFLKIVKIKINKLSIKNVMQFIPHSYSPIKFKLVEIPSKDLQNHKLGNVASF